MERLSAISDRNSLNEHGDHTVESGSLRDKIWNPRVTLRTWGRNVFISGTSQYSLIGILEARTYPVKPLSGEIRGDEPETDSHIFNRSTEQKAARYFLRFERCMISLFQH